MAPLKADLDPSHTRTLIIVGATRGGLHATPSEVPGERRARFLVRTVLSSAIRNNCTVALRHNKRIPKVRMAAS